MRCNAMQCDPEAATEQPPPTVALCLGRGGTTARCEDDRCHSCPMGAHRFDGKTACVTLPLWLAAVSLIHLPTDSDSGSPRSDAAWPGSARLRVLGSALHALLCYVCSPLFCAHLHYPVVSPYCFAPVVDVDRSACCACCRLVRRPPTPLPPPLPSLAAHSPIAQPRALIQSPVVSIDLLSLVPSHFAA